jgi:hypothetical protein
MKRFSLLFSILCLRSSALGAGPLELAPDLGYLRVHQLPADLPAVQSALSGTRALVLDLRHVTTTEQAVSELHIAFTRRTAGGSLYILVGPGTPQLVAAALPPRAMTLGVAEADPAPRVAVRQSVAADLRAYEALDGGTPLDVLISGKIAKERYDEATLVQEFQNGNPSPEPPPQPDPTAAKPAAAPAPQPPPADRVLQRAVHLHRTLAALRPHPPG